VIYLLIGAGIVAIIGIVLIIVILRSRHKGDWCCDFMAEQMTATCDHHGENRWECPDFVVCYDDEEDVFVLPIRDGSSSGVVINYCPWCATQLAKPSQPFGLDGDD